MKSYLYISQEQQPFDKQDLHHLVNGAARQNENNGITGCLHYTEGFFLQYIEGPEEPIADTISRIKADTRHKIFYSASNDQLETRIFPGWSMHWEDGGEITDARGAIVTLKDTLGPFKQVSQTVEMDQTFSLYSRIAYDHLLQSLAQVKKDNTDLAATLAMSVHDLRAPVRAIMFLTELIESDMDTNNVQSAQEAVGFIRHSAARMEMIIDDLLAHFRDGDDDIKETVVAGDLVSEAFDALKLQYPNATLEIVGRLPNLQVSPVGFWRLVNCLIENGLKYNRSDRPTIRISAQPDDEVWRFSIADNGIGIDPQHLSKIFEMFKRLHGRSEYPGTGIGLATCRKIVEGWGGRIWAESQEGSGSTFLFTCPVSSQQ